MTTEEQSKVTVKRFPQVLRPATIKKIIIGLSFLSLAGLWLYLNPQYLRIGHVPAFATDFKSEEHSRFIKNHNPVIGPLLQDHYWTSHQDYKFGSSSFLTCGLKYDTCKGLNCMACGMSNQKYNFLNCAVFALRFNLTLILPKFCKSFKCLLCDGEVPFSHVMDYDYFKKRMDYIGLRIAQEHDEDVVALIKKESAAEPILFDEEDLLHESPNNLKSFDVFLDRAMDAYRNRFSEDRRLLNFGYPWFKIRGDESHAMNHLYFYMSQSLRPIPFIFSVLDVGMERLKKKDTILVAIHIQISAWYAQIAQTPKNITADDILNELLPSSRIPSNIVVYQFGTGRIPCEPSEKSRIVDCFEQKSFLVPTKSAWHNTDFDYTVAVQSDYFIQTSSHSMMDAWLLKERTVMNKRNCKMAHVINGYGFPIAENPEEFERMNTCLEF